MADYLYTQVKLVRVIDGDTLVVDIDLGMDIWKLDQKVRVYGINCPELNTKIGKKVKAFVEQALADHRIVLLSKEWDKYGRLLGEITAMKNDTSFDLAKILLDKKYAKVMTY
jgi:endonuclease YncB( thermonuclease family)